MIASLKGYGKIARALLAALGVFLILGIAGSMWMGSKARTSARDEIVHQAQAITDSSLSLAFQPSDLSDPADGRPRERPERRHQVDRDRPERLPRRHPLLPRRHDPLLHPDEPDRQQPARREGHDQGGAARHPADDRLRRHDVGDAAAAVPLRRRTARRRRADPPRRDGRRGGRTLAHERALPVRAAGAARRRGLRRGAAPRGRRRPRRGRGRDGAPLRAAIRRRSGSSPTRRNFRSTA